VKRFQKSAFTLVELLVVIAIIGILISMLLPAVQQVRESGRRTVCQNNLKQMTLGMLNHESALGFLPSSGWGAIWVGDPLRGFGRNQPGGWMYSLLPYIEQKNLFNLPDDGDYATITASQRTRAGDMTQTPVSIFNCPSRRSGGPHKYILGPGWDCKNAETRITVARADYAMCSGDLNTGESDAGPSSMQHAETSYNFDRFSKPGDRWFQTGISFKGSQITLTDVTDGVSNTFAIGEKFLNPDFYATGQAGGDNHSWAQGFDRDINRWCADGIPPLRDRRGLDFVFNFGSAHRSIFYMSKVDGSVAGLSYDVDVAVWKNTANRADNNVGTY